MTRPSTGDPEPSGAERRREPRILPGPAAEVEGRREDGSSLFGRLVDASPHGLAFLCEERLEPGETVTVTVRRIDGVTALDGAAVRVLAIRADGLDTLAHCAFDGEPGSDWLAALEA
jgi:hypothetical protein